MDNILCIEKVLSWERLLRLVPERDLRLAAALKPASRREEFLMWRSIVYRRLPDAEIAYNAVGGSRRMQLSPPYRSFPLPRIRCGLFLRPSMCRRYRAACPRFRSGGSPLCFCRRAAVVRQSAVVAGPLVRQGDALQIFGAAEPRSAPGFTDRAFRSGRRPDDGPYLRGIRIGNRTSEGGGASCSLYLGVIMLAGVIRFGTFGVSVVL